MQATQDAVDETMISADQALRSAYLYLSYGQYQEAIEACELAASLAPEHPLAPTLKGSFEMAVGRISDALGTLRRVTRRHPDHPLALLYFAEACFLAGRTSAAQRTLSKVENLPLSGALREFKDELVGVWASLPTEAMPPPLVADIS